MSNEEAQKRPASFDDAFAKVNPKPRLTAAEKALLDDEGGEETPGGGEPADDTLDEPSPADGAPEANLAPPDKEPADPSAVPDWVQVPPAPFAFPRKGRWVAFLRFRAEWTEDQAEHQCIIWGLDSADERLSLQRTRGEPARTIAELSKGMVRAIDGKRASFGVTSKNTSVEDVERFWKVIGYKGRQQMQNLFVKTHHMTVDEKQDFFANCLVVRTVAGS